MLSPRTCILNQVHMSVSGREEMEEAPEAAAPASSCRWGAVEQWSSGTSMLRQWRGKSRMLKGIDSRRCDEPWKDFTK